LCRLGTGFTLEAGCCGGGAGEFRFRIDAKKNRPPRWKSANCRWQIYEFTIVGASYSAEDIGLNCHKYGAKSVTMCWRTQAMGFRWPELAFNVPVRMHITS
jgi:hypothetical protein